MKEDTLNTCKLHTYMLSITRHITEETKNVQVNLTQNVCTNPVLIGMTYGYFANVTEHFLHTNWDTEWSSSDKI